MSFLLKHPMDAAPHTARAVRARRASAAPVFKPEFRRSVRMHPVLATVVAGIVFFGIFFYAFNQKPEYEVESRVYIAAVSTQPLSSDAPGAFDAAKYDTYVQQQMQTAQRLDILEAAVAALPAGTWKGASETNQEAAQRLQNALKVTRVGTSYELAFTLRGSQAASTAATVNAAVEAYLRAGRKDELAQTDQRAQILTEERDRIQNELTQDKLEQARLSATLGMANPGLDAGNAYDTQLAGLRTELAAAREAHDVAAAQLASVSGSERLRGLSAAADDSIAGDAGLSSMRATISQRRAVLAGQMAGLTPENPVYKQYQGEIADLDQTLDATTQQMRDKAARRLQDKLHTDLTRTGDVEARLNAQLARDTFLATNASPKLQRAAELNADIHRLTTRFATVDDSLHTLQLEESGPGIAHLALRALPPPYPVSSRKRLLMAASIPLALLCGLFAAVLARKRDLHVYTGGDLDDVLGFTPIAVLPAASDVSPFVRSEYMLRLAGGVEGAYRTNGARTFVLTPAGGAIDIAAMASALENRLAHLGLDATTVTARALLEDHFGPAKPEPAGLVKTKREPLRGADGRNEGFAAANIEALKLGHDLLFIDSPAILTSAETEYVVRVADATILVAESAVTTRQELMQAGMLLERLNVKGIGAVLDGLQLRYADATFVQAVAALDAREIEDRPAQARRTEPVVSAVVPEAVADTLQQTKNAAVPEPVKMEAAAEVAGVDATESSMPEETHVELPVAMLHLNAPAHLSAPVEEAAVQPVMTSVVAEVEPSRSSRHPVRRLTPEPAASTSRSWFSRLLSRDDQPVVSIIPNEDEEDLQVEDALPAASITASAPARLDLPLEVPAPLQQEVQPHLVAEFAPVMQVEPEAVAAPEMAETPQYAEPEPEVLPSAAEVVVTPLVFTAEPLAVQPQSLTFEGSSVDATSMPLTASFAEPALLSESALDEMDASREPLIPAAHTLWEARPTSMQEPDASLPVVPVPRLYETASVESPKLPQDLSELHQVEFHHQARFDEAEQHQAELDQAALDEADRVSSAARLRVERWDAAPAPRTTGPWRDRRVAGSDSHIHPSMDRRFNWAARGSDSPTRDAAPDDRADAESMRQSARPQLVTREPRLTRRWGLLTKLDDEMSRGDDAGGPQDAAEAREYRRG